jgi:hypothetical protein
MEPPIPTLSLGLRFGWGLAGFLAMAAQEIGLGAILLTGDTLLVAMLTIPLLHKAVPLVFVTAAVGHHQFSVQPCLAHYC